jgi:predicted Ser/Thr protein kinase
MAARMMRCSSCHRENAAARRFCKRLRGVAHRSRHRGHCDTAQAALDQHYRRRPLPAGTVLGERYRVLGLLGTGGMGEVYRAVDLKLEQQVALKFLPPAAARDSHLLERLRGEVRIARQVSHHNVCRVYDLGEVDGAPYISVEYVDGETLGSLLRRIGRLPGDKALEFARRLCAGLAAAHEKGVLHRDLKPANIMVDGQGQVRIMDFGLAAAAGRVAGGEIRSGTPAYMAPEQRDGREVTVRSDLYRAPVSYVTPAIDRCGPQAKRRGGRRRSPRRRSARARANPSASSSAVSAPCSCSQSAMALRPASRRSRCAAVSASQPLKVVPCPAAARSMARAISGGREMDRLVRLAKGPMVAHRVGPFTLSQAREGCRSRRVPSSSAVRIGRRPERLTSLRRTASSF